MKKKIQIAGLKIKVSWKKSRLIKNCITILNILNPFYKKPKAISSFSDIKIDPVKLLETKLYRIFKENYCEFFPGKKYGVYNTEPSSYIYYHNKQTNKKYLIGEFMFGENKEDFFKRKNILIKETLKEYSVLQDDLVLATYDKEWVEKQNVYR